MLPFALALLAGCTTDEAPGPGDVERLDTAVADAGLDGDAAPLDATPGDTSPPADADLDAAPDPEPDAAPDAGPDSAPDGPPDAEAGPRALVHLALGQYLPGEPFEFVVPAELDAVLLQARGAPDGVYRFEVIDGPAGALIGDGASRVTLNPEVAVALIPDNDRQPAPPPGVWRVVVASAGADARPLEVELYGVRGRGHRLRVFALVPPATGRGPDDPAVIAMSRALEAQLAAAFALDAVEVVPLALADDAPAEPHVDGEALDFAALGELARAAPERGAGLDLYLVDRIFDGENTVTAFSGGLPAPFGHPDTAPAVAAVPIGLIDDFPTAVADRAVHELGHALGLFHTTEPFGDRSDPISDTAECPRACDTDGDGVLFARECGAQGRGEGACRGAADNLMFWTLGGLRTVTAGQRRVAGWHPVIEQ